MTAIDDLVQTTADELSRQRFVGALRQYAMADLRERLREVYERRVRPAFEVRTGRSPADAREIERLMRRESCYRFYSALRYNAQEMAWLSVQAPIERALPELNALAAELARRTPTGGTLRLNPGLSIPRYVAARDVHLIPGSFHSEYTADDVAQGAVVAHGGRVCTGANPHRRDNPGGVALAIGYWLTRQFPQFRPRRILDLGTGWGKNLIPYLGCFPQAAAYGLDVSAPLLRYGHARAEQRGEVVHFSQQNAEHPDFPEAHFDLIVSSFFFHELPVAATQRVLAQCRRLLAPGGMMVHMELPPHALCEPWRNFAWDWDTRNNNEPFYSAFRSQDPQALCVAAGFAADAVLQTHVPDVSSSGPARYARILAGELPMPRHGAGSWFVFGARA